MLFANWLDVPDATAFLDAFAEAAEKTRGWKLDSIKTDFGHQFVYVRYTGRKFSGKGLMASAFAPLQPRTGRRFVAGGASPRSDTPKYTKPQRGERPQPRTSHRATPHQFDLRHSPFAITPQRVNLTLRADVWPDHICFDEVAKTLLAPLLKETGQRLHPLRLVI